MAIFTAKPSTARTIKQTSLTILAVALAKRKNTTNATRVLRSAEWPIRNGRVVKRQEASSSESTGSKTSVTWLRAEGETSYASSTRPHAVHPQTQTFQDSAVVVACTLVRVATPAPTTAAASFAIIDSRNSTSTRLAKPTIAESMMA